jgi:uncharacterized protein (TIRG00374 family)
MRKNLSIILPCTGLALFGYIVWSTGPRNIADVIRNANPRLALVAVALVVVILVLRGVRWRLLLRIAGIDYPLWRATAVWAIGFSAASVTPAKAGDAIRAFYVQGHTGRSFGEAFFTVFVERLYDLAFVLALGVVSVFVFSHYFTELPSVWIVLMSVVVLVVCIYLALNRRLMRKLLKPAFDVIVPRRYRNMVTINVNSFYDSMASYGKARGVLAASAVLTVVVWALIFTLAWCVTAVLGIGVPVQYMFLIMPVVTLVEVLPVSIGGLGTRDATVIYFFSVLGIPGAAGVAFSLGYLLIGTYLTALLGFILWLRYPLRKGSGSRDKNSE